MIRRLPLTMAFNDYDRVAPIRDGRVPVDGCDVLTHTLGSEEIFLRAHHGQQWDVCEMSLSRYLIEVSRGQCAYVALPVFVSRTFRHGALYVRSGAGIDKPEDLRGRVVGVPEYQMTAALWVRGMLDDVYGVGAEDIRWRSGGLEQPGREELLSLDLPLQIELQPLDPGRTLCDEITGGAIDAIVASKEPSLYQRGSGVMNRLFEDFRQAERDYFTAHRIFPIMHVVVMRRQLAEQHPWLPASLYKAFTEAKALAMRALRGAGVSVATLPWLKAEVEDTIALMGPDYWPYGVAKNLRELEAATRYSHKQGLSATRVAVADLFAPDAELDVRI